MMVDWASGDVIANGIKIHYTRTGGDKPPLVLSHGSTDNGLCWTRVALALEKDYDLIMPDARGHGLSEAPEKGYDDENRAADLAGFIRAMELGRPALMGHSMGAATTAMAAVRYPELARCIVLEDPAWFDEDIPRRRPRMNFAEIIEQGSRPLKEIEAYGRERAPTWHELDIGPCPTLLVTGDSDVEASAPPIVTPEIAAQVARMNANVRVVRIAGAGHSIRRMQFEAYVEAVSAFLAEVY
jgi:N-formylmaleamate deformylase